MTEAEYLAASLRIERLAQARIELLSSVSSRAIPRAGESNIIHDAVAGMAKRERNASEIANIQAESAYEQECLEAQYYGFPLPEREER